MSRRASRCPLLQDELAIGGWAIEARLYAENPATGFLPSTGPLDHLRLPEGIRVDSGVEQGDAVTSHYDPMIAKLIVHAPTRQAAAARLAEACGQVQVWPVRTNAAFLARALDDPDFRAGQVDTGFIERHGEHLIPAAEPPQTVLEAAALALLPLPSADPWRALAGFRGAAEPERRVAVEVNDIGHLVTIDPAVPALLATATIGEDRVIFADGEAWAFSEPRAEHVGGGHGLSDGAILAPMPGRIVHVSVSDGDPVKKGDTLLTLEAMKMEHRLTAPFCGTVTGLAVGMGDQVSEADVLLKVEARDGPTHPPATGNRT